MNSSQMQYFLYFIATGKRVELSAEIVAGASTSSGLPLSNYFTQGLNTVSRQHFRLIPLENRWYISDLNATNGTEVQVKGVGAFIRLAPYQRTGLQLNDIIRLSQNDDLRIEFRASEPSTDLICDAQVGLIYNPIHECYQLNRDMIPRNHIPEQALRVLDCLWDSAEKPCTYQEIAQHAWGYWPLSRSTIQQTVRTLRKSLDQLEPGAGSHYIRTITNVGYWLTNRSAL